jgi:ubiquinone/menaquinone biosynthesis C-methylase UbiE
MDIKKLYVNRFSSKELEAKNNIWKVLTKNFFQKFININSTVVDIGAGYCEFINNISCKKKIAVDINPDTKNFAQKEVKIINELSTNIHSIPDQSIDIIFMSNFLEHLKNKEEVLTTLKEINRILYKNGKIIILQPNYKYLYKEYWNFFDHHIPLTDVSLCESLELSGFKIEKNYPKFLPYTTKSKIPKKIFLVKMYLKFPLIWKLMGKQCCIIAKKIDIFF